MKRVKVLLCGPLKKLCPDGIEVVAATAARAIEIATRQIKGLRPHPRTGPKRLAVVGHPNVEDLVKPLQVDELKLVPAFCGQGDEVGQIVQVVVGIVLIVVGVIYQQGWLVMQGLALVIGGALAMLVPAPNLDVDNERETRSKYLGEPENTVQLGTPIPVGWGMCMVGGHFLSFDMKATDTGI
jgi:predicted phage tail protein